MCSQCDSWAWAYAAVIVKVLWGLYQEAEFPYPTTAHITFSIFVKVTSHWTTRRGFFYFPHYLAKSLWGHWGEFQLPWDSCNFLISLELFSICCCWFSWSLFWILMKYLNSDLIFSQECFNPWYRTSWFCDLLCNSCHPLGLMKIFQLFSVIRCTDRLSGDITGHILVLIISSICDF